MLKSDKLKVHVANQKRNNSKILESLLRCVTVFLFALTKSILPTKGRKSVNMMRIFLCLLIPPIVFHSILTIYHTVYAFSSALSIGIVRSSVHLHAIPFLLQN